MRKARKPRRPAWVVTAEKILREWLAKAGIEDEVRVEVWKRMPRVGDPAKSVGSYARHSQFRGSPVLRLSANIPEIVKEDCLAHGEGRHQIEHDTIACARDTLVHEYGHVVWEFARLSSSPHPDLPRLRALVTGWKGGEEQFAEDFAEALGSFLDPAMKEIVALYAAVLRSEQEQTT